MFIGHYGNITLFYHTHVIDGVTYCHSHLYWVGKSSTPVKVPLHTKDQLKLIQDVNQITWNTDTEIPIVGKPILSVLAILETPTVTPNSLAEMPYSAHRAPPSLFC